MIDILLLCIRRYLLLFLACSCSIPLLAQEDNSTESSEFDDFRKELQDEYANFRKGINSEYVDFLSKAWKEYRLFQEEKNEQKVLVRAEKIVEGYSAKIELVEEVSEKQQQEKVAGQKSLLIDYFGAELSVNYQSRQFQLSAVDERSVGNLWKGVADSRFSILLNDMLRHKQEMQMNDWACFLLAEKVASRLAGLQSEDCRTVFRHFLLAQPGYDVRLARIDRVV